VKKVICGGLLMLAVFILSGCNEGFPDEEMHFGIEEKVRPYAVIVEPPEAAPGETVQVTLLARVPDLNELDISWKVALDYSSGMYETDQVERNYVVPQVPFGVVDGDGFFTQSFLWTVPDSALLVTSDIPEVLVDPVMVHLAEELIGPAAGSPPTRTAVDAWLKSITPEEVASMGLEGRMAIWALADRFASQVRFRTTLQTERIIDVTRNLTVRHTGRLFGPNTNVNPLICDFNVMAVEKEDATQNDLHNSAVPKTVYHFFDSCDRLSTHLEIPFHEDWTYYLTVLFTIQDYSPPFDPSLTVAEGRRFNWYYYRQDKPLSGHQFFATENGDEAEMYDLDGETRIMPDGVGSTFRVVTVGRDHRYEWVMYNATPGVVAAEGVVEFVAP